MKRVLMFLIYVTVFVAALIYFAPKQQLYYMAEREAHPFGVIFSEEMSIDKGFGLNIEKGRLFYQDLEIASMQRISITPLLIFNRIDIAPFEFSEAMHAFVPGSVSSAVISHSVIDPFRIHVDAEGDFGTLTGVVHLKETNVSVILHPSDTLKKGGSAFWLKKLKQDTNGGYIYEADF